ncbi:MAG: 2-C-methyl-D-erythritol 2,4-cyclodiphosphate synthase [Candidatus Omnitrophica bacterium]|nr:2-C-methyl-D-erythritol 2,4-cyclodiphosphate synthase [Candidatus Omnitrophota bacterium]MBU0895480.1 2-C-methyl-D-erythritol 2,4-cyclodiphosphate synthase [Candidatus Omnitrophota bacterium]MBU1808740.1 2-C-methyl-D-erythritol 2,4-cyclodiphosphate synthase [Candidatus Omnitrophota bacterium]
MRVGIGYDIHRLVDGRKLFLGGVEIPYVKGLLGHSDGDVVMHALADAMLGALALGDIGLHFPDTDPQYKDISSGELVKKVLTLVKKRNLVVNNADTMILAEEPKIHPFRDKMVETLSKVLNVAKDRVNIKATTVEGVGSIGKGEAIAAYAVVTLGREEVDI